MNGTGHGDLTGHDPDFAWHDLDHSIPKACPNIAMNWSEDSCAGQPGGNWLPSADYQRRLRAPIRAETTATPMIASPYQVT